MDDCLFCKIVKGEIPADKVFEDDHAIAFRDIDPQAPQHILVIPRQHYVGIHEIPEEDSTLTQHLFSAVIAVVVKEGLAEEGYRLVLNFGARANQTVPHIHVHILGGRAMHWPPG
jgi:histidine triad (HIT) family protein